MSFNSYEEFHGGSAYRVAKGNVILDHNVARVWTVNPDAAGRSVILPDARRLTHAGGPVFEIINLGAFPLDVEDQDSTLIGSIPVGEIGEIVLLDNSTDGGDWRMQTTGYSFPDDSTMSSATSAASSPASSAASTTGGGGTSVTFPGTGASSAFSVSNPPA